MQAFFRADMSPAIGSGHVARCLTLASALASKGASCTFLTHAPSDALRAWVAREGHVLIALEKATDAEEAARQVPRDAMIVVDGYHFRDDYRRALRGERRLVVAIDDLASEPLTADVIVNGNLFGARLAYRMEPGTTMLLGPEFALVRDEFVDARLEREARARVGTRRVFVTMGGADPTAETERVLTSLDTLDRLEVRVAVGPANPRLAQIRSVAERSRHRVEVLADVRTMGSHMAWCDVVVSAAGGTCLEIACAGVPGAAIVVAENQRRVADALCSGGLMAVLGRAEDAAKAVARLLADEEGARAMEQAQRRCVDGHGKHRVTDALLSKYRAMQGLDRSRE